MPVVVGVIGRKHDKLLEHGDLVGGVAKQEEQRALLARKLAKLLLWKLDPVNVDHFCLRSAPRG
jgi:hypothetical protein